VTSASASAPEPPRDISHTTLGMFVKETYEVGKDYFGRPVAVAREGGGLPFWLDSDEGRRLWRYDVLVERGWGSGAPMERLEPLARTVLAEVATSAAEHGRTITHVNNEWRPLIDRADEKHWPRDEYLKTVRSEDMRADARDWVQTQRQADRAMAGGDEDILTPDEAVARYRLVAGKEWLPGIMPMQATGTLFGPPGSAKTLNVVHRNLCLGNGMPFYGVRSAEPAASLLVPLEDEANIGLRYKAGAGRYGLSDAMCFTNAIGMLDVFNESDVSRLLRIVEKAARRAKAMGLPLAVTSIDTARHIVPGRSLSDDVTTAQISLVLRRIVNEFGCNGEVLTHTPNTDGGRETGSGEQRGSRDYSLGAQNGVLRLHKHRFRQPAVIGYFQVEPALMALAGVASMPVLVEVSGVAVATAAMMPGTGVLIVDEANAWNARDQVTAVEVLRLMLSPATDKKGRDQDGWSYTALGRALKELAARPVEDGGVADVHTHFNYIREVVHGLRLRGLVDDDTETHKRGTGAEWNLTEDGRKVLREFTT
jgi:hypothetical protein